ncbi:MAG: hypothetical protein K2X81_15295, partial [Candidatus Obscuribacterales bacterium]|nr:hypothetical protein [Candidatus Obscuribacterales bacterium]
MNSKEELKSAQEDKKFLQASSDSEQTCEENSSGATLSSGPAAAGVEEQNLADKPPSCGFDA